MLPPSLPTLALAAAVLAGCAPVPRLCSAEEECAKVGTCVGGRCQSRSGVPAIETAARLVVAPSDVAYLQRGGGPPSPRSFALGRRGHDALLLARFALDLPRGATLVEAYLLLDRAPGVDTDGAAIDLRALRVLGPWDGATASWARQPPLAVTPTHRTPLRAPSPGVVRIDVRALVAGWAADRASAAFGLAIVAEGDSPTGVSFLLMPAEGAGVGWGRGESASLTGMALDSPVFGGSESARGVGPRLELYLK